MNTFYKYKNSIENSLREVRKICAKKGLNFTKLRSLVLQIIWMNHGITKAYDILDKLKIDHDAAKPSTVYRTLKFLLDHGLIHKLESLNAYVGCSHPFEHKECYFLICSKCKEVKECCNDLLSNSIINTSIENKFYLKRATLEMDGECQMCFQQR